MGAPVLIVVDMQNDFVGGVLGSKEAKEIVPRVAEKIRSFPGRVIYTRDTHGKDYLNTQEGKKLPVPHCEKGTQGWELCSEVAECVGAETEIFDKNTFGSQQLAETLALSHKKDPIPFIQLIGVCTDICVISNALLLKAFLPEVPIQVDGSCCAGVTPKSHQQALDAMACCQVEIL